MNIKIENLTKKYGVQKAVDDISFEVKTGEILGFLGPNGAGKSTTMKMITHYLNIDEGDVIIDGQSIKVNEMKKHIGYLPEHNPLYEEMPVMDYLKFAAELQGVDKSKVDDRIKEMIVMCGLNVEKHKKISELSKGYRQRVGLAQAMIHDPDILILDEPTTGLDPNQIVEIRELIKTLGSSKTVILSTHILPEVEATCDRIMIINKGKIVADGTAETLRKTAQGSQVLKVKILGPDNDAVLEALNNLSSVQNAEFINTEEGRFEIQSQIDMQSNEDIFRLCAKNNWVLTEMIPFETKLEDIFRNLTVN
ncbi:MAG: ATP-binding cassette domain-containing protein [Saprospiraceae bacterium]|nr:ATP-binding cassette domain-containing protein [Bacteroidia bacterium]NNL93855.1 ATP-binding cassette domain-containing protein [Saprospiraceae bacterium]